ncbi:hypothetical protein Daus18300_000478 [Diaporthe australafricana]|uniref:AAA+ ATPase domain-containing protein n=1 Tax=Diaporthe australafricana TaxID=127596 RepID=A0ABR3Y4G7_9PEZI
MSHDILGRRVDRFVSSERAERIRIVSPLLQKALTHVGEYHPFPLMFSPELERALEMDAPYLFLFHHREELNDLAKDEKYKEVLCPLLEFLAANYSKEYEEADLLFKEGAVTAYHVSKLFKPGQMVISRQQKTAILEAHVIGAGVKIERDKINIFGWSWAFDGTELQRAGWGQRMESVPDERVPIKDLKIHPAEFARNEDVEYLVERGKKFWGLRDQTFMVDMSTYKLMHVASYAAPPPMPGGSDDDGHEPTKFDPWPRRIKKSRDLSDKKFMLLPSSIFGFRLQAKKWKLAKLLIENFHGIEWNRKAFERLVLDDAAKKMIYALVDVQKSAGKMDDIIAGKGNGLIVLLHGSPGTGKTLTAESVAEIAEKPLYRVTCGDIGTEAKDVENYLETVLYLGKTWDCVFLRTLEYYEGILILTSNRVGTFDEAFKSRIQVAIHYDNLTKKSRKAIWRNLFDMIEESEDEDANMAELERRLDELASHEMNGRQIRNALLTARQLAKHQGERLDWKHLSQVMKTSADFNKYLKTVKGHSDDQWAREEMLR